MAELVAPDADAVALAFALGAPLGPARPAARGELGRIWSLETDSGRWAVKELWQPMSEAAARADVEFQRAARSAGLQLPDPRTRSDGRVLARVGATTVRVYAWADLTSDPPEPAVAGELLARLHRLELPPHGEPNPWFRAPVGEARWRELVDEATAAGAPWADAIASLVPELLVAESILSSGPARPLITCHLDFGPDNVVLDASGRPTIIDWENAGPEVPERELGMTLLDWARESRTANAFLDGYAGAHGRGRLRDRGSFATALAVRGHLLEFYARRALSPNASDEDRGRSRWRIDAILERPVTFALIDELLDQQRV